MSILNDSPQNRSKLKRKCKLQTGKSFQKQHCQFQKPKFILSKILEIDYGREIQPKQIKPCQIETYGALTQNQLRIIFQRTISRDTMNRIIIDALKLCYLYTPLMQAIQTELQTTKQEYKVKDILSLLCRGNFYQFLILKTQPAQYLINNRSTQINIKTIISGIVTIVGNKLSAQTLSDVVLFYRLEQALYQTAPYGLPFEFEKIIKAMKKIDRNITADKFTMWEKKINNVESKIKFLQPYHFVYLMSLSQPVSKKKANLFQVDRKESKFQKQSQMMSIMKQKNNFIDFQTRKTNWKNQIKVRGLSFQQKSQVQKLNSVKKDFCDLRKRIISHKRVKSAYITGKAVDLVKKDLKDMNQRQNEYLLDTCLFKPAPQKSDDRKLLKKHNKRSKALRQFQNRHKQQHQKFTYAYKKQLSNHLKNWKNENNNQEIKQEQSVKDGLIILGGGYDQDEQIVDIYSHHLMRILANVKGNVFVGKQNCEKEMFDQRENMLKWL